MQRGVSVNKSVEETALKRKESFFSIASIGFFLILVGAKFAYMPDLYDKMIAFFKDFTLVEVPNTQIQLPAPTSPETHLTVYSTAWTFCLIWGIYETAILIARFFAHSSSNKKSETLSNIIFWFGASYLINGFLNETATTTSWFAFWTLIITLIGISLIVRGVALATLAWQKRKIT
jgi:hypothetical protein